MLSCGQCRAYGSSIGPACRSALCRGGNGLSGPNGLHGIGCNRSCLIQSGMIVFAHDRILSSLKVAPASLAAGFFAWQIGAFKNPHFSIRTVCGRIPLVCDRRGRILFYTQEESAVLGGFLSSYLNRDSASDHVRDAFARFQVGLERGCLQKSELQWAEQMLLALKPLWWEEWEDHRALMSVLLKTQALLRADK